MLLYPDGWGILGLYLSEECEGGYPTFIHTLRHEFCDDAYCECPCHDVDLDTSEADPDADPDLPPLDYDD